MKNDGVGEHCIDISSIDNQGDTGGVVAEGSSVEAFSSNGTQMVVGEVGNQSITSNDLKGCGDFNGKSHDSDSVLKIPESKTNLCKIDVDTVEKTGAAVNSSKKASLLRSDSSHEHCCRVCQQLAEEALIELGCKCRGGLSKAHRSCIDTWFRTKGSNICEICQQVAVNVPPPESQPSRSYWAWRVDPTFTMSDTAAERERVCHSPLWVAFSILIGGLLLDVLISISLGISALPVNIIIGVLVVLGLGTALRLALECCHELSFRRTVQSVVDTNGGLGPLGYHPAV